MHEETLEMYINAREDDEVRVAIVRAGQLIDYFAERQTKSRTRKGDIYVGKVANVDDGLGAAFVDIGEGPHGFLSLSDVKYPDGGFSELLRGRKTAEEISGRVEISRVLRKGQKVLVQVIRETLEGKGPSLTTFVSIPGRLAVLVPDTPDKSGISRKIEDAKERQRLNALIKEVKSTANHGIIVRTVSEGCTGDELKRDLAYIGLVWDDIAAKVRSRTAKTPRCVFREGGLLFRVFRDVYSEKIEKVFVDSREAFDKISSFLKDSMPNRVRALQLTETRRPLFEKYGVERQIESIFMREVDLANGGSIVVDQTEAMIAIDVNSGNYSHADGQESIALETNLQAADEVARQLRLRDIGGLVCIDFIDMRLPKNQRKVETRLKAALKADKARINLARISEFGVLEMTRQRNRQDVIHANYMKCPVCRGSGYIKSKETLALEMLRNVRDSIAKGRGRSRKIVKVTVHPDFAAYLKKELQRRIAAFEEEHNAGVEIIASDSLGLNDIRYSRGT